MVSLLRPPRKRFEDLCTKKCERFVLRINKRNYEFLNCKAQTILELFFVLLFFTFFFATSFAIYNVFDISQKQVMLVRTQAFMELGNHSDFGLSKHGEDAPDKKESQVMFRLGEDSSGTRVQVKAVESFEKAVQGELELNGIQAGGGDNRYWEDYRFPKSLTTMTSKAKLVNRAEDTEDLFSIKLSQNLWITHGRSIAPGSSQSGDEKIYTGSVKYFDLEKIAKLRPGPAEGLIDNQQQLLSALEDIAKADPSLADEAANLERKVNAAEGITGGAEAALISLAIQLVLQAGLNALGNLIPEEAAGGELASAGSDVGTSGAAGAAGSGTTSFGIPDFLGFSLKEGETLYNFGQINTFASQVLNTANMGFSLAGKNIEGLQVASAITGSLGGIAGGAYGIQHATSASGGFSSAGQLVGGLGQGVGLADAQAGQYIGLAGAGLGLTGSVAGIGENFSAGGAWKNADGTWKGGKAWEATSAIGGAVGQAGGMISSVSPGSQIGSVMGLAGGAIGSVGAAGSFGYNLEQGTFNGKPFQAMTAIGGLGASISSAGISAATLTGNEKLAETFAYAAMGSGAVAMVGAMGMLAQNIGKSIADANQKAADKKAAEGVVVASADGSPAAGSSTGEGAQAAASSAGDAAAQAGGAAMAASNSGVKAAGDLAGGSASEGGSASAVADAKSNEPPKSSFDKFNEAFTTATKVNSVTSAALQVATQAKAAMGLGASTAIKASGEDGFREGLSKNITEINQSIKITTQQMNSLSGQLASKMEATDYEQLKSYMDEVNKAQKELEKPEGQQNLLVIHRGKAAADKVNDLIKKSMGQPIGGSPEYLAQQEEIQRQLAQSHNNYEAVISADRQAINWMLQSESLIEGRSIISGSSLERAEIRREGLERANFIERHREKFYAPDHAFYDRFRRAELAWRRPQFVEPSEALNGLRQALQDREARYQQIKRKLLRALVTPEKFDQL